MIRALLARLRRPPRPYWSAATEEARRDLHARAAEAQRLRSRP